MSERKRIYPCLAHMSEAGIIPTLTGEVAQRFNERAAEAEANRGSVDFSEQVEIARSILAKAHLD